jgi:GTP-binding protein
MAEAAVEMSESPGETPHATSDLPRVAIVGRANVGKSTLFNRLLRERRSLVEDTPGVTRDRVASPARIEGREVLLVDTGGLDPDAEEGIPAAVASQVRSVVADAAVILFVTSARDGVLPADRQIADMLRRAHQNVVLVVNKCDGPLQDVASAEFHRLGFEEVLPVSAEHRRGVRDLELAIHERLPAAGAAPRRTDTVRCALIGRPNAGKSSLLNRMLGAEHAIVSEVPGTTRDATDTDLRVNDRTVTLIDTAGLRRAARRTDRLERGSAYQSLRAIERAQVVLLVLDASVGATDQDARLARLALDRGRALVLLLNKWDLVPDAAEREAVRTELARRLAFVPEPVLLEVSALSGKGVHRVLERAIRLADALDRHVSTAEVNRALREAVARVAPPVAGRRRPKLYYATQISVHPLTILLFVSDPEGLTRGYRRYLESSLRRALGVRSAPLRLRLRARPRGDARDEDLSPDRRVRGRHSGEEDAVGWDGETGDAQGAE